MAAGQPTQWGREPLGGGPRALGQTVPYDVNGAPSGATVAVGDKGDIIVTDEGGTWSIDPAVLSAFARTLTAAAGAAAARAVLGAEPTLLDGPAGTFLRGDKAWAAILLSNVSGLEAALAARAQLALANAWPLAQTFNALPVLAGGGLQFPAVQVPSADANVLDDYEEGVFTPGLTFGGGAVGMTFNVANTVGRYTKIGRMVFFSLLMILTAKGSSTGSALVTGLPFSAAATVPQTAIGGLYLLNMATLNAPTARILNNASAISMGNFNGTTVASITDANFTNTSAMNIAGFYAAAA